jgi:hypothetical protein
MTAASSAVPRSARVEAPGSIGGARHARVGEGSSCRGSRASSAATRAGVPVGKEAGGQLGTQTQPRHAIESVCPSRERSGEGGCEEELREGQSRATLWQPGGGPRAV